MRKLYLIRHGQTIFNDLGRMQGQSDSPLTDLGYRQTYAAKQFIEERNITFDAIYSSPLRRCIVTTKTLTDQSFELDSGLMEWNFGYLEGELNQNVFREIKWSQLIVGQENDFFERHQGESFDTFTKRYNQAIETIIEKGHQSTLLVTHGGVMRMFYKQRNTKDELKGEFFMNNCILEYNIDKHNELEFVAIYNPAKGVK